MISVDRVGAPSLSAEVQVEPAMLLPPDHREGRVQRVQFHDLDVPLVLTDIPQTAFAAPCRRAARRLTEARPCKFRAFVSRPRPESRGGGVVAAPVAKPAGEPRPAPLATEDPPKALGRATPGKLRLPGTVRSEGGARQFTRMPSALAYRAVRGRRWLMGDPEHRTREGQPGSSIIWSAGFARVSGRSV